jgi:hypothetical protein
VKHENPVSDKAQVIKTNREGEEKSLTVSALKRSLGKGVFARLKTDSGKVVRIGLHGESMPEKATTILSKTERLDLYSLETEPSKKDIKDPMAPFGPALDQHSTAG